MVAPMKHDLDELLRNLRVFVTIAREGQFQRAAVALGIDGAAISRRIQGLERELKMLLFIRHPGGARLSAAGASLYADLDNIVARLEAAISNAQKISAGQAGILRVGYVEIAGSDSRFASALRRFEDASPGIETKLQSMLSGEQTQALKAGDLDVGFILKPREADAELEYRDFVVHEMVLALPKEHQLSTRAEIRIADLRGMRMLWPDHVASSLHCSELLDAFNRTGIAPRIVAEVSTSQTVLKLVAAGVGIGFVDNTQSNFKPDGVVLRPVLDYTLPITLQMAWARSTENPLLEKFISQTSALLTAR